MASQTPPGGSTGPSGSNIIFQDLPKLPSLATAHGTVMGLAFIVVMPLGVFLIRFVRSKNSVWIHAACQLLGLALMVTGLATGIRMAKIIDRVRLPFPCVTPFCVTPFLCHPFSVSPLFCVTPFLCHPFFFVPPF